MHWLFVVDVVVFIAECAFVIIDVVVDCVPVVRRVVRVASLPMVLLSLRFVTVVVDGGVVVVGVCVVAGWVVVIIWSCPLFCL